MKILFLAMLASCSMAEAPASGPYAMTCEYVGSGWRRCVNQEVVCYTQISVGMSCVRGSDDK